ncbi:SRPBCC family protein [Virgibacillus salinus]|uniref:Uncharacterized conserved protein YndB, AHSA1/START domain n=1 Tax=Virgibacillus salinus TaxID=553311 RepID=A0A1H0XW74_9BACI|nr:SRPBCC domain-containing protein [Virgibacillus salinus]SDQ07133.1 Uncharacterized conserved protein YndB, AHSA1/START domain [Virgibacillus salinus]
MTNPNDVNGDKELTLTRIFDAPRELVWKSWTKPELLAKWWGPAGFQTPKESIDIDLRVGGWFNICMVQINTGTEIWIQHEIIELVEPRLLVLRSEEQTDLRLSAMITRVQLDEMDGKTKMTLHNGPYSKEMNHAISGWEQSFDKLVELFKK